LCCSCRTHKVKCPSTGTKETHPWLCSWFLINPNLNPLDCNPLLYQSWCISLNPTHSDEKLVKPHQVLIASLWVCMWLTYLLFFRTLQQHQCLL
jgi:hypothetical protein